MTNAIQYTPTISCLESIVLEPYLEGAERLTRAINGVNLHHIHHPKIDCSARIRTFVVGMALMTPLINCVIWIFMKTIGDPEKLHETRLLYRT
jgi:hypothetical protein